MPLILINIYVYFLYTIDQHRIFASHHSLILTGVIAKLCQHDILSVATKFGIKCFDMTISSVKLTVLETFAV